MILNDKYYIYKHRDGRCYVIERGTALCVARYIINRNSIKVVPTGYSPLY